MKKMKTLALCFLMMAATSAMAQQSGGKKAARKNTKTLVKKVTTQAKQTVDFTIEGSKGKLAAVMQTPSMEVGAKIPMVILMHGFTGNKESTMLTTIADTLQANGIAVIRFDFNGHGKSEGKFEDMTVPNEIEDAKDVFNYAKALPFVSKVAIMGHSQGGVVASMLAGELNSEVAAVALAAPAAVLREDAIRGNNQGTQYDPLNPPATVPIRNGLSIGRNYIKTAQTLPIYETAAKYQGPAIIVHGTGDVVVPWSYGERYHQIWPNSEFHLLPGFDHGFSQDLGKETSLIANFLIKTLQ